MPYTIECSREDSQVMVLATFMLHGVSTNPLYLQICAVVFLIATNPACSSNNISSRWSLLHNDSYQCYSMLGSGLFRLMVV